ncbi:MAG: DUF2461 domain-containing protein [Chloroflexi bacterium]|nr:DUF2461 domain-containing protein [Chloroflexota bacterium]MCC6893986.1 DUF2461 domain-containing protein [Anaerolineae bacterium]
MPENLQFTLDYLLDLRFNNNKPWFDENRQRYQQALANFESLVADIIRQFGAVEDLGETTVKECLFRINRDIRFTKDKTPYKSHFSAHIGKGGRKGSGRSYYVQVEPGGSFIAGGVYAPEPEQLKRIRAAIAADNGKKLNAILAHKDFKRYFGKLEGEALKTAPKGYDSDHPAIDLLKQKQFIAFHRVDDEDVLKDDFAAHIVTVCKALKPFEGYFHDILGEKM